MGNAKEVLVAALWMALLVLEYIVVWFIFSAFYFVVLGFFNLLNWHFPLTTISTITILVIALVIVFSEEIIAKYQHWQLHRTRYEHYTFDRECYGRLTFVTWIGILLCLFCFFAGLTSYHPEQTYPLIPILLGIIGIMLIWNAVAVPLAVDRYDSYTLADKEAKQQQLAELEQQATVRRYVDEELKQFEESEPSFEKLDYSTVVEVDAKIRLVYDRVEREMYWAHAHEKCRCCGQQIVVQNIRYTEKFIVTACRNCGLILEKRGRNQEEEVQEWVPHPTNRTNTPCEGCVQHPSICAECEEGSLYVDDVEKLGRPARSRLEIFQRRRRKGDGANS